MATSTLRLRLDSPKFVYYINFATEFAARVPVAGSAYQFTYLSVGELWAFIIGWNVAIEHAIYLSATAKSCARSVSCCCVNFHKKYISIDIFDSIVVLSFSIETKLNNVFHQHRTNYYIFFNVTKHAQISKKKLIALKLLHKQPIKKYSFLFNKLELFITIQYIENTNLHRILTNKKYSIRVQLKLCS